MGVTEKRSDLRMKQRARGVEDARGRRHENCSLLQLWETIMGRWMQYNGLSFTECRFDGGHGKIRWPGFNNLKLTRPKILYPRGEVFFFFFFFSTLTEEFTQVTAPVLGGDLELIFRMSFTATEYFCLLLT